MPDGGALARPLSGRVAEGLAQLDEAINAHETLRAGGIVHSIVAVHLGEACVLTGRRDQAASLAERALTLKSPATGSPLARRR